MKGHIMKTNDYTRILLKAQKYLSEGVLIFDAGQKNKPLIFINKGVSKILGYSNRELIGKSHSIFKSEGSDKVNIDKLNNSFKNNKSSLVDLKIARKDGIKIFCRLSIVFIPEPKKGKGYLICILRDITEARKELLDKVKLSVVESTLRTINDIVFNYFNNIQIFRWDFEKFCDLNKIKLHEFDELTNKTINKLKKINELKEYKERKISEKISVLLYS